MKLTRTLLLAASLAALSIVPAAAQNSIWGYTALGAAPATDDKLFIFDTSATASKTITINNLFTSPTLVTPTLGAATATTLNKITITAPATGATLTIPDGVTLTGPATSGTTATLAGTETLTNKTISLTSNTLTSTSLQLKTALSDETGSGAAVFATSPTLVTPVLGVATATSLNGLTITTSTGTLTIPDGVTLTGPATSGTTATLAGTETLTNKTITSAVLGTGLTASGSASNDFSGSTGTFKTSTGLTTISGGVTGAVQALSGAGAVNLTTVSTHWTTTGADAGTLADGTAGQIKIVIMKVDGGTGTLTPTTASGFTSVTFDDPGDAVTLEFVASIGWVVIGSRGVTF